MIVLLSILGILALLGLVSTVVALIRDGLAPVRTDWSRSGVTRGR